MKIEHVALYVNDLEAASIMKWSVIRGQQAMVTMRAAWLPLRGTR